MSLHPDTRAFLGRLQLARARCRYRAPGVSAEEAAEEGMALEEAFEAALDPRDGDPPVLLEMEPNVIVHELAAGKIPEEFHDGPIFHPEVTM